MKTLKNWWYGWNGPAYKWYKLTRWFHKQLGIRGLLIGNCAGCGKTTKGFDPYYEWHICPNCSSDEVAYNLAEHVAYPNGRENDYY